MTQTAAPAVFALPAGLSATLQTLNAVSAQIAQSTRAASDAVSAAIAAPLSALQRATAELQTVLSALRYRREEKARNSAALRSFLAAHLSRRARTLLGLLLAPCAHAPRAALTKSEHSRAHTRPLATCQAMNAPGAVLRHTEVTRT